MLGKGGRQRGEVDFCSKKLKDCFESACKILESLKFTHH